MNVEWRRVGGVDWLRTERSPDGPAELGLVIAHGYADESPADIGLGAAAIAALVDAVGRPLETTDHRVVEPHLSARVGLQETVLLIHGEPEAVLAGALSLERRLTAPGDLDGSGVPDPRRFGWTGWSSELAAWLGAGTATLAAENVTPWTGERLRFQAIVQSLHPDRGRRVVAWTNVDDLVGVIFAELPATAVLDRARPAWREPAPCAAAGAVTGSYANNLITVRMPAGPLTDLALRLLGQTVHRSLVVLTSQVQGVEGTYEQIGSDGLYALRAIPKEGTTDWYAVREALVQAIDALGEVLDTVLAEELDAARRAADEPRDAVGRAVEALRAGGPVEPPVDPWDTITIDDVRSALRQVQANVLVCVPDGEGAPVGRTLFVPPDPGPVTAPTLKRRTRVPIRLRGVADRQRISADARTLQETLTPTYKKVEPGALGPRTTAIDLTAVVARLDFGSDYSTLIDADDRRVVLAWPAYRRPAALRRLVDDVTPPGGVVVMPPESMAGAQLRSAVRKQRVSEVLVAIFLVIAAVLVIWHPTTGKAYQQATVTTAPVGSVITLGNGSTVQVSDPQWRDVSTSTYPVLVIDVRYCGGGETVDRNTASDARNYLSPQRFTLTGTSVASRQAFIFGPDEPELKETQLQQGQCTAGKLAFDLDANKPAGIQVAYRNGSGDQLTWTV